MRLQFCTAVLVMMEISVASGQVASHAPTTAQTLLSAQPATAPGVQVSDKPVAWVNGTVLTDRDLLREMYTIFPYARQHNGFPKELEPEIRRGALEMIIFDELVYQEARRRHATISPARLTRAEVEFRKQFPSQDVYEQFLKVEMNGSRQVLHEKIRRSLLIEAVLKTEVQSKAAVSLAEARAYYDKNPKSFERGESFGIQTISIIPPQNASAEIQKEARQRAEEALRQAKATKSYREFGLLAEKVSDDDWRVNMGDRRQVDRAQLPPPLVAAALKMKLGEVSDLLQFGPNYTLFRLNAHTPAGKADFSAVKTQVQSDIEKARYNELRAEFHKRLRKNAKVEVL
jgi:hypothetical protein